mmetsp:Transcript_7453/g.9686  ORF Transcript_7453/g.9686 Transcript_7453/m.9686 type:complete len:152 (+) Transcript_7453:135-590(+)|eukprot:CAMPEP_0198145706 /NCGR_PEP_ID=MMETSP1443-20131203/24855_1 /TAXON_ID=186043 /ORGANISM="Entomoneis sp., Strain CCMP2396" /LENGTH=151 /DNA_ID=CAMNT_0043809409 /DNA_START=56 /DNA_END=511 /DNA_ORIENTATION=+
MVSTLLAKFKEISDAYGPALTKALLEDDLTDFKGIFLSDEPLSVVLQSVEGEEIHFTVGDNVELEPTMSWEEFHVTASKDVKTQDYVKTISESCGVLGDRMIMQTARINKADEMYSEAFFVVTLDETSGKISMMEAFSFIDVSTLLEKAES